MTVHHQFRCRLPDNGYRKNPPARLRPSAPPTEPSSDARHHRARVFCNSSGRAVSQALKLLKSPKNRLNFAATFSLPFRRRSVESSGATGTVRLRSSRGTFPLNQFEVSSRIEAGLTHLSPFTSDVDSPSSERKSIADHHRWTRLVVARRLRPFP
ncbi:UNVERIFIED_CONTAM: hypothetical protein Sangu_2223900 [Sesamum angustifolium]|uniref:Uncharacterized protein n=1 Tax=Sesamum angustifolium TaxID=2727405 RepID=A0AAW2L631_9LAMI